MRRLLVLVLLSLGLLSTSAQAQSGFGGLRAEQRLYDLTGALTADQTQALSVRLDGLQRGVGADVVVVVREKKADPDQTLEQVEDLQQAWVKVTGRDQDTAVGILVNREPGQADEARAGIYVGRTYDDGNVPRGEQEKIVSDALIPPLREGDVAGSLAAGLDRLTSDIVDGPPRSAFQTWADGAMWVPYVLLGLALVGAVVALGLWGRRETADGSESVTVVRPGDLEPALVGALVAGRPSASTVPAVVVDLAARGALVLEPEGRTKLRVRLGDASLVRGEVELCVWNGFASRADAGVVGSSQLAKLGRSTTTVKAVVEAELRERGWWNPRGAGARTGLVVVGVAATVLLVLGFAVTISGLGSLGLVGLVPLSLLVGAAFVMAARVTSLSREGAREALGWKGYRQGLSSEGASVDLDAVLPDIVVLGLGQAFKDRLREASRGSALRAFASVPVSDGFVPWMVFNSSFASPSAGGGSVSGGGAGGGGGAAGST